MSRLLLLLPLVAFAGFALAFWLGMRDGDTALPSTFLGQQAPSVLAIDAKGVSNAGLPGLAMLTDADLRKGRVSVVNFWASWCPPCRAEHPTLLALAAEGVQVFGVNMMDDPANALQFLAEGGNPYAAIAADPKGRLRINWGVTAPPETFIVLGDGTIAYRFIGPMVGDDYRQRFRPELEKALAQQR